MSDHIEKHRHRTRSVIFLLSAAVQQLWKGSRTLILDHSFGDGYYCVFKEIKGIRPKDLELLKREMDSLRVEFKRISIRKAVSQDWKHLKTPRMRIHRPPVLALGDHHSLSFEFTELDLGKLPPFTLQAYDRGFILRMPAESGDGAFVDSPKLFSTMKEHEKWGRILDVSNISDLNHQIMEMGFKQLIWVAEGLHEKKLSHLADDIISRPGTKVIFVAGPSSSGKTTFTKRLAISLAVNGLRSKYLSMDNYFLNRDEIPPQADGTLDFENVDCLDMPLLTRDIKKLVYGEPVNKRSYNFIEGRQEVLEDTFSLGQDEVLIFEGIHGLNPLIHGELPEESFYRVYISALTQLNIDNTHPVSTSDGRLIRRIVRDHHYRGYSADQTLQRWNSVRHGELRNIFPFQEQADAMFNSALIYELSILKRFAMPLLRSSAKSTVRDRLMILLSMFHTIPDRHVPGTSILREFIGKSYFTY